MEWLNYHHLYYFYTVAREGSVTRATEKLNLTQPTISAQLRVLEESLGEKLFVKAGRGLALTERGRLVYDYAEQIFTLGRELRDTLKGRPVGRPARLVVGVADVVPKLVAWRILQPAFALAEEIRVVCVEDETESLFARLALHELDLVLCDSPVSSTKVRAFNHLLGESGVSLFASPPLAQTLRKKFPSSLENAPILLPLAGTQLRRELDHWMDRGGLRPRIVGEFQDMALLMAFGQAGAGVFAGDDVIGSEIERQFHVRSVGAVEGVRERFYVVSPERRLKHPAVVAITETARSEVFGG